MHAKPKASLHNMHAHAFLGTYTYPYRERQVRANDHARFRVPDRNPRRACEKRATQSYRRCRPRYSTIAKNHPTAIPSALPFRETSDSVQSSEKKAMVQRARSLAHDRWIQKNANTSHASSIVAHFFHRHAIYLSSGAGAGMDAWAERRSFNSKNATPKGVRDQFNPLASQRTITQQNARNSTERVFFAGAMSTGFKKSADNGVWSRRILLALGLGVQENWQRELHA